MIIPYTSCPICSATPGWLLRKGDATKHAAWTPDLPRELLWICCRDCGHLYTSGHWNNDALKIVLDHTQAQQTVGAMAEIGRVLAAETIEHMQMGPFKSHWPYAPEPWLEIGFGSGDFLLTAKEYGIEAHGVDIRLENVDAIREFGVLAHYADFLSETQFHGYKTFVLLDVIEHLPFPRKAIERIAEFGGQAIMLSTPNAEAPFWEILNKRGNPYWHELEHYHIFTRTSITKLLADYGFEVQSYRISKRYKAGMEIFATRAT